MEDIHTQLPGKIHQEIIKGSFNDIQVICKNGSTTGSRLVLAVLSPYFEAMLSSDMAESRTGVLNLPSVQLSVFQDIIKMYLCKMNLVNNKNCIQVLDAAEMMQLDDIKHLCYNHLKNSLVFTAENCLSWWRLLKLYNFLDLSTQAFRYLVKHLDHFVATENVIQLSMAELQTIISKEDLNCEEDTVMKCSLKWIETNNPDTDGIRTIFQHVRMTIVDPKLLIDKLVFTNIICQNSPLQQKIRKVLRSYHEQPAPPWPSIKTRLTLRSRRREVFVLHYHRTSLLSCFTSDNKWEDVPPAPIDPGIWYSAASLDDRIYITGGNKEKKCTLIYDTYTKEWEIGPDLNQDHSFHCMATALSQVFAIGGVSSNKIEQISQEITQWQVVADLGLKRFHAFAVTVGEKIFIMGGTVNHTNSDLIQCFNATTHTVSTLDLKLPCSSVVIKGCAHLPDVYLLDYDGTVMHITITHMDGDIQIKIENTAEWIFFKCAFGIALQGGNLLCFTKDGIKTFNLAKGKEEKNTFPKPPRSGNLCNVLRGWSGRY
ncbi:kelch-like protein 5 [Gigantopelta aegis]|uniref:kelch-like protein 5 n=1 Tax=Gigantopelta aegis TaxID=1735272 RepID=UPI001B889636|nr:kelch-like protein 5 [Gigantopelta aegis]